MTCDLDFDFNDFNSSAARYHPETSLPDMELKPVAVGLV